MGDAKNGKDCVLFLAMNIHNGKADFEYGNRFGVDAFEILVDQENGVWMRYEGYDADGVVQSYVYTESVLFGTDAVSVPAYTSNCSEGYSIQSN